VNAADRTADVYPAGTRVEVWWPDDAEWYAGRVIETRVEHYRKHGRCREVGILYDDAIFKWHTVFDHAIRVLDAAERPAAEQPAERPAAEQPAAQPAAKPAKRAAQPAAKPAKRAAKPAAKRAKTDRTAAPPADPPPADPPADPPPADPPADPPALARALDALDAEVARVLAPAAVTGAPPAEACAVTGAPPADALVEARALVQPPTGVDEDAADAEVARVLAQPLPPGVVHAVPTVHVGPGARPARARRQPPPRALPNPSGTKTTPPPRRAPDARARARC
jgi:hypothetical protein